MTDNLRGIVFMILAMGFFALEDSLIKLSGQSLPMGQIMLTIGTIGASIFATLILVSGKPLVARVHFSMPVYLRMIGEAVAALGFMLAIINAPISISTAIFQATPLMITVLAAVYLKEDVGWRRWSAIIAGFVGVLIVIRPGTESFEPMSLFALVGVIGTAVRDTSARVAPATVSTLHLAFFGMASLLPTGAVILAFQGGVTPVTGPELSKLGIAALCGSSGYFILLTAMRRGDVSAIIPFRYTRLLFAVAIGMIVFDERPDFWTYAGSALIIASGIYIILRERALSRSQA